MVRCSIWHTKLNSLSPGMYTAPSVAPDGLTAQYVGSRNVTLTWNKLAAEHQNGDISYYTIYLLPTESFSWLRPSKHIALFPDHSYTVLNLHPHSNYNISVAAFTIAAGPNSTAMSIQTRQERKYDSIVHEVLWIRIPPRATLSPKLSWV